MSFRLLRVVIKISQVVLVVSFLVVVVRHHFFAWESFVYVVACGGFVAGVCALLQLVVDRCRGVKCRKLV